MSFAAAAISCLKLLVARVATQDMYGIPASQYVLTILSAVLVERLEDG
jgi:hypothetical protein